MCHSLQFAPCVLRGRKTTACSVSKPKVEKGDKPDFSLFVFISCYGVFMLLVSVWLFMLHLVSSVLQWAGKNVSEMTYFQFCIEYPGTKNHN